MYVLIMADININDLEYVSGKPFANCFNCKLGEGAFCERRNMSKQQLEQLSKLGDCRYGYYVVKQSQELKDKQLSLF